MISSIILNILYFVIFGLTYPIRIFNDVTLPAALSDSITTAMGYLQGLDFVLPIPTLLTLIVLTCLIEGGIIIYKSVMWLIRKIPFIN